MDYKNLLRALGFSPKENACNVFTKKYLHADNYCLEVDFEKTKIDYGNLIRFDNKTTQNFSQPENFVVLECVNRLLEKGYKPEHIVLEKTWGAGHGTSGRLDICVEREDGSEYLLIECKTYGKEFEKEFARMKKDGGQLFTYFKFSNKAYVIMLYASELRDKEIIYRNEIVKIEEDYRTGDVKDFYEKWNKLTKNNGIFDAWVKPYNFESKALTTNDLVEIKQEDSSFIFNQFLEILRHNVVSDKGNAFNRIFTLFLCKIYDEKVNEGTDNELGFQWFNAPFEYEGVLYEKDNHRSFQIRLTDLYKNGMHEFLEKVVTDFSETEFNNKYQRDLSENIRQSILDDIKKIRLEKNNEFAIKDVYDEQSFNDNAVVVKEIVELLQGYKLRYTRKQQYLSDFFELLLTTGLKQESGQFFTPVPVAQFVIKSLPIDVIVEEKLSSAKINNNMLLPYVMDYASGSGHFVTEMMHEIQRQIETKKDNDYHTNVAKEIRKWQDDHFLWAIQYIYGIEKDYRLVKVGKVGCYLHGDGLANVVHSDGLARFNHPDYKGKLLHTDKEFPKENKQFDIVVSNPPYSVSAFKNNANKYYNGNDFELYDTLTDNSSEIECLFVERTKQLLKDGGVAGVILPSSILSNEGIYTKAREIILKYFEIVAITELGSNTFMATGTNTVVLFLRRRNNYSVQNFAASLENSLKTYQDNTINGIEKPVTKYINHVWSTIGFDDYISLLKKEPNNTIANHEIYKEYQKKIKEKDFWNTLIEIEKEKLLYFILAYPQKIVLVKTGEKDAEKRFLGYEFSYRRGSEGIHPIQRGKTIDECTKLFDDERFDNPEKASTYIYKAFLLKDGEEYPDIDESLKNNISRVHLVDMLTFDRATFAKNISTAVKKKVKIDSKWENKKLSELLSILESGKRPKGGVSEYLTGIPSLGGEHINLDGTISIENMKFVPEDYFNQAQQGILTDLDILICKDGALTGKIAFFKKDIFPFEKGMINEHVFILRTNELCLQSYLFNVLFSSKGQELLKLNITGTAQGGLNRENLLNIQIPLPPKEIQEKIVSEIEVLEKKEAEAKEKIETQKNTIQNLINSTFSQYESKLLGNLCESVEYGTSTKSEKEGDVPVIRMGNIQDGKIDWTDLVYTNNAEEISKYSLKTNDVLFNRTNSPELVGKVGIYKGEQPAIFAGYLIRINYKKELLNPVFLTYVLNSETMRNYGFSVMSKSVNQANINGTILKTYRIPLPPLSEQQKIVSEIEKIEAQITEAQKIIENMPMLKNEVLKKYL